MSEDAVSYYRKFCVEMISIETKHEQHIQTSPYMMISISLAYDKEAIEKRATSILTQLPITHFHLFENRNSKRIFLIILFSFQNLCSSKKFISLFETPPSMAMTTVDVSKVTSYFLCSFMNLLDRSVAVPLCDVKCLSFSSQSECYCYLNWRLYNYSIECIVSLAHEKDANSTLNSTTVSNMTRENAFDLLYKDYGIDWNDVDKDRKFGSFFRIRYLTDKERQKHNISKVKCKESFFPEFKDIEKRSPFLFENKFFRS